jgi:hypothetical protein
MKKTTETVKQVPAAVAESDIPMTETVPNIVWSGKDGLTRREIFTFTESSGYGNTVPGRVVAAVKRALSDFVTPEGHVTAEMPPFSPGVKVEVTLRIIP